MPEEQTARAGNARREEGGKSIFSSILQSIAVFMLMQYATNYFFGKKNADDGSAAGRSGGGLGSIPSFNERPNMADIHNASYLPNGIAPIWPPDSMVDMKIYVSVSPVLPSFSVLPPGTLVLEEKNFRIGDYEDTRTIETSFAVPKQAQENGTLFAHFFVGLSGQPLDPTSPSYSTASAEHFIRPLNHYIHKKKHRKLKSLLDKGEEDSAEDITPEEPVAVSGPPIGSFYHPNFTLSLIPDSGVQSYISLHPAVRRHVELERTGARDASGQNGWYYPIVFVNTFWQLKSQMTELNSTVDRVPLYITLNNLANWKFSLMASLDEGMKQQAAQAANGATPAGGDGSEMEKIKEVLLDTNIYLLGTTVVVSIFHMIFEGLAFKNDISHWRKKKDNVGTSVRSIIANVFMQTVIFLYLLDNSEGTSWMILASQGFGIVLEAWKITKTANVRLRRPRPNSFFAFLPYVIVLEDKYQLSDKEKETEEYDRIAFKYLYMVAVPLLLAYAGYSLVYEAHKGWYSFIIETLVGSVYAYGFLMMVPSLYINYRLKSVAHMPSKAMTYKFLNTFIDDLFAFTIKMPTLHRLATLRDDVIFFIWLYQKWVYRVDYSRVNEFGQGGDSDDEDGKAKPPTKIEQAAKAAEDTAAAATATGAEDAGKAQKRK